MLVVWRTDKGRYSVRPDDWVCVMDYKTGVLYEDQCNHTAIFADERNAEQYAAIVNACERRRNNECVSRC